MVRHSPSAGVTENRVRGRRTERAIQDRQLQPSAFTARHSGKMKTYYFQTQENAGRMQAGVFSGVAQNVVVRNQVQKYCDESRAHFRQVRDVTSYFKEASFRRLFEKFATPSLPLQ